MSARGEDVAATGVRTKKGMIICSKEEEQCSRSFMHTSTDSRRGIGQKNLAFWTSVALHYARHNPKGGVDRPTMSLETKWCDIKVVVAKFTECYWTIEEFDESGKTEYDIVLDAMNLYKQKCGKAFVFKHCWLLLKNYPRFVAIFMGKQKARGYDMLALNQLPVDRRDVVSPNGDVLPTEPSPAQLRPQGAKSSKADIHLNTKVNAKATIDFVVAALKKVEQIAQQNTFSLFTLEDKLITCDMARQWLRLRRYQELTKLKVEVVVDAAVAAAFATSNVPAPPPAGVCSSPNDTTPSSAPPAPPPPPPGTTPKIRVCRFEH
jgi:hypothetical protein